MRKMTKLSWDDDPTTETLMCKCGCGNGLALKAYKFADDVSLEIVTDIRNKHIWTLREKLKRIWCILTDKEYCYFDMICDKKDLQRFKSFVAKL